MTEDVAKAIYWAAFEIYPPGPGNPIARLSKERAWELTSREHRRLALFQAQRAIEAIEAK